MEQKRKHIINVLKKELGSIDKVKDFSATLRYLDIVDLSDDKQFTEITKDGAPYLIVMVTWYTLGLLSKLKEIKQNIKETK